MTIPKQVRERTANRLKMNMREPGAATKFLDNYEEFEMNCIKEMSQEEIDPEELYEKVDKLVFGYLGNVNGLGCDPDTV